MRLLVSSLFNPKTGLAVLSLLILGLVIAGCGGGGSTTVTPTTLKITAGTSVSLTFGQVQSISAQLLDQNGNAMTNQKFIWTSSNSNVATVTATGGICGNSLDTSDNTCLCAGTWSSDLTVCKPPSPATSGTSTITVSSGGLTATTTALVHAPVARVGVSPANVDCLSAAGTQQMTATAYDAQGNDITSQVAVGSSSFNWASSDSTVVSLDANGLATAVNPGRSQVYASIAGTSSSPASFTTCPVVSISLALSSGSGSTFSIAQAATQQLTPTVTDSNNKVITVTSGRLTYSSSYQTAVGVNTSGLATGSNPGSSAIVASCSPPSCNNGLYPVFSNVINGTTQGTTMTGTNSKTTQAIVASPSSTSLIPIDLTTATAGTALTLPYKPNSLVFSRGTAVAYLGSDTELMGYNSSGSTITGVALIPGVIINLSNDALRIVIYDDTTKTVTVFNLQSSTIVDKFSVPQASLATVHAATSPDDQTTYIVVGNTLYVSSSTSSLKTIPLNAPANDVAFTLQGSFAYLGGGENSAITARTNCDTSERDVVAVNAIPDRMVPAGDGSGVYAVSGSVMNAVTGTTTGAGCPPALTDSLFTVDMGQGTVSPTQMFTSSDNKKVYMISSAGKIVVYDTSAKTATSISLTGGANATTGALTMDGATLYVGGGADNKVHVVDTASNSDTKQISVSIPADLVAVKNQ